MLHGQGCLGELSCEPGDVDFGTTVIGTSASHKLTLTNPAPCNIHYQLTTEEVVQQDGRSTRRAPGSSHGEREPACGGVHVCLVCMNTCTYVYTCVCTYIHMYVHVRMYVLYAHMYVVFPPIWWLNKFGRLSSSQYVYTHTYSIWYQNG